MNHFFNVKTLEEVLALAETFGPVGEETVETGDAWSRVLAEDITAKEDMPGFRRACMDGYAVRASDTFGASESTPAWLEIAGTIAMGETPEFELPRGSAARISTGGMLPAGADAVVMVEHSEAVDEQSVEIYKSVAPLQHVIDSSEDFAGGNVVLEKGSLVRPQEQGLLAGLGHSRCRVFKTPKVGIISTGDEIIPIEGMPGPGKIRDINSYSLAALIREAGGEAIRYGIVKDDPGALKTICENALAQTDMVLISGGSSVGARDYTVEVLAGLADTQILVHGMSVSPGKPTILARSGKTPVWGLPGQVTSAMVVLKIVVIPFLNKIQGLSAPGEPVRLPARLTRNLASAQGRRDFVRVALHRGDAGLEARPVLGKSGLIRTMVHADGLLEIGEHVEGLEKGSIQEILLF
ncbi:MAG: molybdopterin molybdotransferase MoeA [Desulfobacter sp.]|nr:MAG: molybdopterin molybdotransferase MoeA [Desulfobacter sp.]